MVTTIQLLLNAVVMLALAGCVVGWVAAWSRVAAGGDLLPYDPRRPAPWGLIDLGLAFVVVLVVQVIGLGVVLRTCGVQMTGDLADLPPSQRVALMAGMAVSSLLAWAVVLLLVKPRSRATWAELGIASDSGWYDLRLGLTAFAMLSVPVFLVQWLLTALLEPFGFGKHPLIESLLEDPDPTFFIVGAFSAVLVAPIVEEYFFRLMLQGWLENLSLFYRLRRDEQLGDDLYVQRLVVGACDWPCSVDHSEPTDFEAELETERGFSDVRREFVDDCSAETVTNDPWLPPRDPRSPAAVASLADCSRRPARWPIGVSSLLFAAAHIGHGAAPVPLFLLALGLGYLYQRTHRILPCIVVHMLVNGLSMAQLWVLTRGAG